MRPQQHLSRPLFLGCAVLALWLAGTARADVDVQAFDLGTIGGEQSWGNDINDDGVVVGKSGTRIEEVHAFLWRYDDGMIDLGTLGGGDSRAVAVDAEDNVFGNDRDAAGAQRGWVWSEADGMRDLGTLGGNYTRVVDANAAGMVIGDSRTATGATRAFLILPAEVLGVKVWFQDSDGDGANDLMIDLGTLGGSSSNATALDADGVVVGYSRNADGNQRAFAWDPSSPVPAMLDLGTLGGTSSWAFGVNDGVVVGSSYTGGASNEGHAFRWTPAQRMVDLGVNAALGKTWSRALFVSDTGVIVGQWGTASHDSTGFIWRNASSIDPLPDLSLTHEEQSSIPLAMSGNGRVTGWTGYSGPGTGHEEHAFLWRDGQAMLDLGAMISDRHDSAGAAVNDAGFVAGWFEPRDRRAFVYSPLLPGTIDLGTLGGVESAATAISPNNTVVGWSETPPDEIHAYLHDDGGFTDLGLLPDATTSEATAVASPLPVVAGTSSGRPFRWWPTMNVDANWATTIRNQPIVVTLEQIGNHVEVSQLAGFEGEIVGRDITLTGSVLIPPTIRLVALVGTVVPDGRRISAVARYYVGRVQYAEPITLARTTPPSGLTVDAAIPGEMEELDRLGGSTTVTAVNRNGFVAGTSDDQAARWDASTAAVTGLGTLPGDERSIGSDLDDSRNVVGSSFDVVTSGSFPFGCTKHLYHHALRWDAAGDYVDLGALPGRSASEAVATNNRGFVVGTSWNRVETPPPFPGTCPGSYRADEAAFVWSQAHGIQDLGTLSPGWECRAIDINDANQVFGSCGGRFFLLTAVEIHDRPPLWSTDVNGDGINDLMFDLGEALQGTAPRALNDATEVAGSDYVEGYHSHAFVWSIETSGQPDNDGDGYTAAGGDCHDGSAAAHPGAAEICDGLDNDCDGTVDEGFDNDGDGYSPCLDDCRDDNAEIHPGAEERCNRLDDDCDGVVDESPDYDFDGVGHCQDNCTTWRNPQQVDSDFDGYGDACDPDYNNDGAVGIPDFNVIRSQFGRTNADPGFAPICDHNGDGAVGITDFNLFRLYFGGEPGPSGLRGDPISP